MDSTTSHLLQKLDLMRETQRDQTELLRLHTRVLHELLSARGTGKPPAEPEKKTGESIVSLIGRLPIYWQWIAGGIVSWAVSASISAFLKGGGDPLKLLELLLKAFA